MDNAIIVSIISMVGTLGGSFLGILTSTKLSNYRIEQLEKKVEKHNSVVERTYQLEGDINTINIEIKDIKQEINMLKTN